MSYIGRGVDAISNVEKLDNITFNGGTTYALTKSSAAFTPVGANNILISIDGVIQQGNFSVSTTNIVFDWSPTSSNTCNFILHYGTGVLNVPADGSVSLAKMADDAVGVAELSATGTASSSTFLRGDNAWTAVSGFDVSSITGATALAEQPQGTDEMVISDAGTLKRLDTIHMMNRPFFRAYMSGHQSIDTATATVVAFDEEMDTTVAGTGGDPDSTYNTSNYRWTPAVAGFYFVNWTLHIPNIDDGELMNIQLRKNGAYFGYDNTHGGQIWNQLYSSGTTMGSLTGCAVVPLDNNDYVDLEVSHNEGAAQSVQYWYSHWSGWRIAGA